MYGGNRIGGGVAATGPDQACLMPVRMCERNCRLHGSGSLGGQETLSRKGLSMIHQRSCIAGLVCALIASVAAATYAQDFTAIRIASGLSRPVFVTAPPGDMERIFIVEQRSGSNGRIRIIKNGQLLSTPFLSITVSTGSEQGLLGLAFHPDYANNGYFYVNYTRTDGNTVIARYTVSSNPDIADVNSAQTVLVISQPFSNHNGGYIAFGPLDGYLYINSGDGGSANDPQGHGQNINSLLGKILRLDINGDDFPADPNRNYAIPPTNPFVGVAGADEIWAYGLRNPWRADFDDLTGDFYIGDVGQNNWEEIDFQPGNSPGGENYGWRCMEGNHCTGLSGCTCNDPALTDPIYEYSHDMGCSVTGGVVYRGSAIPGLSGTYFFSDFCTADIYSFRYDGSNITEFTDRTTQLDPSDSNIDAVSSFGEDAAGEIYICDLNGEVFKIVPRGVPCDAIRKFKAKCSLTGKIKITVRLWSVDYNGQSVKVAIDNVPQTVTIVGDRAKYNQSGFTGSHVVSLVDPSNCRPNINVSCP